MKMNRKRTLLITGLTALFMQTFAQKAPEPYGLVPSERQLEWYDREMIAFFILVLIHLKNM